MREGLTRQDVENLWAAYFHESPERLQAKQDWLDNLSYIPVELENLFVSTPPNALELYEVQGLSVLVCDRIQKMVRDGWYPDWEFGYQASSISLCWCEHYAIGQSSVFAHPGTLADMSIGLVDINSSNQDLLKWVLMHEIAHCYVTVAEGPRVSYAASLPHDDRPWEVFADRVVTEITGRTRAIYTEHVREKEETDGIKVI